MYLMKAVLKPPPAIRILRVALCTLESEVTVANGRWPAPSATDPTAERTTNSLLFMRPPLRERCARTARSMTGHASLGNVRRPGHSSVHGRRRSIAHGSWPDLAILVCSSMAAPQALGRL